MITGGALCQPVSVKIWKSVGPHNRAGEAACDSARSAMARDNARESAPCQQKLATPEQLPLEELEAQVRRQRALQELEDARRAPLLKIFVR